MKKYIYLFVLLAMIVKINPESLDLNYLISGFGEYRFDFFHTGIDIGGENKNVLSPVSGEMIFFSNSRKNDISCGTGNFVVLQDFKNENVYVFAHLKNNSINQDKIYYQKNDVIGLTGNTGYPEKPLVHIDMQNINSGLFINPLKIIKVNDTIPPVIEDVYFITEDKKISLTDYRNFKIRKGGKLYAVCYDRINGSEYKLAPYRITAFVDGKEIASIKFDAIAKRENDYVNQDEVSLREIYSNSTAFDYYLVDFISLPKVIGFKLVVEDYNGNIKEFKRNLFIEF